MKTLLSFTSITLLVLFSSLADGQIIFSSTVGTISGPSDISTLGTSVDAIVPHDVTDYGATNQSSGTLVVGDTTFNVGNMSDNFFSVSGVFDGGDGEAPDGFTAYESESQEPTPPSSTSGKDYDEILTQNAATGGTATVNISGLTLGQEYQVQIFNATERQTTYTSGTSSLVLNGEDFGTGTFVANGTTASFTFTASGGNDYGVVSDIALRAIPEPSTYAAMILGLGLLAGVSRFRSLAS